MLSGKGGVGKTTTTINLGIALHNLKKDVIIVDANLDTPNVALQLGFPPKPLNIHSVLRKESTVFDAITQHESGLKVIQAGLSMNDAIDHRPSDFQNALAPLQNNCDIILLDCGAGLWGNVKKAVQSADEALIVTNPELPALVDALKAVRLAEQEKVPIRGIVVNKVTGAKYDLKEDTITGILKGYPIISEVPLDINVMKSISARRPVVMHKPASPSARAYRKLASTIAEVEYTETTFMRLFGYFYYGTNGGQA